VYASWLSGWRMKHECTVCSREFYDDSGGLPGADSVHCVFCGSRIPLRPRRGTPALPPFYNEAREEAAALGVIGGGPSQYPDTLKQFPVHRLRARDVEAQRHLPVKREGDTLMPVAQGSERPGLLPRVPELRGRAFWLSLALGFATGIVLAGGAATFRPGAAGRAAMGTHSDSPEAPQAATSGEERLTSSASVAARPPSSPTPPSAAPSSASSATANARTSAQAPSRALEAAVNEPPAATRSAANKSSARNPNNERFEAVPRAASAWSKAPLLDRARALQRRYRLREAEELYRAILATAPQDSEALAGLGELELLRGTPEAAEQRFNEALRANRDYIPALIAMADLRWQAGDVDEARRGYQAIVEQYTADLYPPYVELRSKALSGPCGN